MSNDACCAHLHVVYRTTQSPNGLTHGWWECESCHEEMPSIDEARALRKERDKLRKELDLAKARLTDIQEVGVIRDFNTDWYEVRELILECLNALYQLSRRDKRGGV
jgi:hypothetical protein